MSKSDNLQRSHVEWLIASRASNQRAALDLYVLLEANAERLRKHKELATKAQLLVAVSFSLWRAAFLADKSGLRKEVLADTMSFLGKMLTDNAITYAQDRASREWTFNYYMNAAKDCLLKLATGWPEIQEVLSSERKATKGTTVSSRRWDRHQVALEHAISAFSAELEEWRLADEA